MPKLQIFAVIFVSQRTGEHKKEYEAMSEKMVALAGQQKGFVGIESVRDENGKGITVSYWQTLEDIAAWKANAEHQVAQELGRSKWYQSFQTKICQVIS
jgi:heme-degrading monooxygenase HmoA